jgi:cystinosin
MMTIDHDFLSELLGWGYFTCWSLSFYPQFLLNCKKSNTEGLSVDFTWLNFIGFACYAIFNCMLFFNARVKQDDESRGGAGLVKLNDVFFALHALVLTTLTLAQVYWYARKTVVQPLPLNKAIRNAICLVILFLLLTVRETLARNYRWDPEADFFSHNAWTWLGWCLLLSFVKLGVTLTKYFPQAMLNYRRKSTVGWSIGNVVLDFSGGALSLAQLCVDVVAERGSIVHVLDNPVKLFLALFSIAFDVLFMFQHFYLYLGGSVVEEEYTDLMGGEDSDLDGAESTTELSNDAHLTRAAIPQGRRRVPSQRAASFLGLE